MKFCVMVGLPDTVTRAKLDGDRLGHFCVVGGWISGFPIDFGGRPSARVWQEVTTTDNSQPLCPHINLTYIPIERYIAFRLGYKSS